MNLSNSYSFKKKQIYVLLLLFGFLCGFLLLSTNFEKGNIIDQDHDKDQIDFSENEDHNKSDLKIQSNGLGLTGIGEPRNITEFGTGFFENNDLEITNDENATITVLDGWETETTLLNITEIYEYNKYWMNETFDEDPDSDPHWSTNDKPSGFESNITYAYNYLDSPESSIFINHTSDGSEIWNNIETYWNFTFELDRHRIPFKYWYITFDYKLETVGDWLTSATGPASLYYKIYDGEAVDPSAEISIVKLQDATSGTWNSSSIDPFTPELYDITYPNNISITIGIDFGGGPTYEPTGYLTSYFDNITLNIPSIPKPSQIDLNITDVENSEMKAVNDIDYGKGDALFSNPITGDGSKYEFHFTSNSTSDVFVFTDIFVNATKKSKSLTELKDLGTEFSVENNSDVIWTIRCEVDNPSLFNYENSYYFNISKPWNWNVTNVFDSANNDVYSEVKDTTGIGNETLIIKNSVINGPAWRIIAESSNYILDANIWNWTGDDWHKETEFKVGDKIKINATLNSTDSNLGFTLTDTNSTLSIYYPNGTKWQQTTEKVESEYNGYIQFSNIVLGALNASAGQYIAQINWTNNDLNISQAGLFELKFNVTHHTTLKPEKNQGNNIKNVFSGDTILVKVNYSDSDTGEGLNQATVNYTITPPDGGLEGVMVHRGGGVYDAEVDTSGWESGNYTVAVSARKEYYESQYSSSLINITIVSRTTLTTNSTNGLELHWGSNGTIGIQYNITDGSGIDDANIDCNWNGDYHISPNASKPGHYIVEINTSKVEIDTYSLIINATKTGYLDQEISVPIRVRQIYTNISYEQPPEVPYLSNVTFDVQYGDLDNNDWITNADISISNDSQSLYWDDNIYSVKENPENYSLTFNSSIFRGGGTYQIYITANKTNHLNATTRVNIFVGDIGTKSLEIYINDVNITSSLSYTTTVEKSLTIKVEYNDILTDKALTEATVSLSSSTFDTKTLSDDSDGNFTTDVPINTTSDLNAGTNFLTVYANQSGYVPQTEIIAIQIIQKRTYMNILLDEDLKSSDPSIKKTYNEIINITVKYNDNDTGAFIRDATVELSGSSLPTTKINQHSTYPQYSLLLETSKLDLSVNILTIYAYKENYEGLTHQITVQVVKRPTDIEVKLNGNKSLHNKIELPIHHELNITVKYFDNLSNSHISNTLMQLVGEGSRFNFTENQNLTQYSININTNQLDIGIRFLTVYIEKENYEVHTPLIEVQVNRIRSKIGLISHNATINTEPGKTLSLNISLKDLDNNILIKNATLRYTVEFEQAEVLDLNNDGYYEILLSDLPEGTYTLVLTAYAGDDYEFKRFEIFLNVIRPAEDTTLLVVLSVLGIGAAIGSGGYLIAYQRVLKYPQPVRKIHKFKKNITKSKSPTVSIRSRDEILKELYKDELEPLEREMKGSMKDKIKKPPKTPET